MRRESSLGTMTWGVAEPGTFLIRGKHYLRDNKKVTAIFFISMIVKCLSYIQAVGADWCSALLHSSSYDNAMLMENTFLCFIYMDLGEGGSLACLTGVDVQVKAGTPLMHLAAADWFKSNKREDHIATRDGCVIQKLFAKQVLNFCLIFCGSLKFSFPYPSLLLVFYTPSNMY